jgi:hypothetical protein
LAGPTLPAWPPRAKPAGITLANLPGEEILALFERQVIPLIAPE